MLLVNFGCHIEHFKKSFYHKYMMKGGALTKDPILSKIVSIGFELESGELTYVKVKRDNGRLIVGLPEFEPEVLVSQNQGMHTLERNYDSLAEHLETRLTNLDQALTRLSDDNLTYINLGNNIRFTFDNIYPEVQNLQHVEFLSTFYEPETGNNILLRHFKKSLHEIKNYLDNYRVTNKLNPVYSSPDIGIEQRLVPFTNKQTLFMKNQETSADGFLGFGGKFCTSIAENIGWTPQCTLGIPLEEVPEVVKYVSKRNKHNYYPRVKSIYDQLIAEFPDIDKKGRGLLFLAAMFHTNIIKSSGKFGAHFAVRHPWSEILEEYEKTYPIAWNPGYLSGERPDLMVYENVQQFPYKHEIVLIEMRDFSLQLRELFKTTKKDKLTISFMLTELDKLDSVVF